MNCGTLKRVITAILTIAVALTSMLMKVEVYAADTPSATLTATETTVKPGKTTKMSIQLADKVEATAFSAKITFDSDVFTVGKITADLTDVYYGDERADQLILNWVSEDLEIEKFKKNTALVTIELRVSVDAVPGKTYSIELGELEFYNEESEPVSVTTSGDALVITIDNEKSEAVEATEQKINISLTAVEDLESAGSEAITATALTACLDKITEAQTAFNKLDSSEKKQVSNYTDLQNAISIYNKLLEIKASQDSASEIQSKIDNFKTTHKRVLEELTIENVAIEDEVAVNAAVFDYVGQDAYIRKCLKEEYQHLLNLKQQINQLISNASAEEAAEAMVAGFLSDPTVIPLLTMTPNMITDDNYEAYNMAVELAISTYENSFNDIAKERLKNEYTLLKQLYDKCLEMEIRNAPDEAWVIEEYNAFREKYGEILAKTEIEVTADDIPILTEAIEALKELKPAVKAKLITDYERLMNLLNAANSAEMGSSAEAQIVEVEKIVENERVVEKLVQVSVNEDGEKVVRVLGVEITSSAWFGLLIFAMLLTTMILYAMPIATRYVLRKKKEGVEKHVE